jgi:hypothetical protein
VVELMNPGYVSYVLLCIIAVLCASGWKDELLKEASNRAIFVFLCGWAVLSSVSVAWVDDLVVNLSAIMILICVIWSFWMIAGAVNRLHVASVGLLLASVAYGLQIIQRLDPILFLADPSFEQAILVGLIAAAALSTSAEQLGAIALGLLISDIMYGIVTQDLFAFELAGKGFQDRFWMCLAAVRLLSLLFRSFIPFLRGISGLFGFLKKGGREP